MSPKKTKNSVKLRNDTPMATTVVSFPVTPYHHENPSPQEDKRETGPPKNGSVKRRNFEIFRRKVKTNLADKSTTKWNLSSLLKSTLPSMTKDVISDNDVDLKGLFYSLHFTVAFISIFVVFSLVKASKRLHITSNQLELS